MSSSTISDASPRRTYRPDDRLDYEQAEREFPELAHRYLRTQLEKGRIDAFRGAGGKNYFRYEDLLALRDSTRVRYAPKSSSKRRPR